MSADLIRVRDVDVSFFRRTVRSRRLWDHLRVRVARGRAGRLHALRGVSIRVAPGERVGIIGRNGAGKSTLLRVMAGVIAPERGSVAVAAGRTLAPLIELGIGFHPELSGRENCYLGGSLLGISAREMRSRIDEIVTFAELADFIDEPIKTYSSGMYARLAFALATCKRPDILLLDEVLAVGDQFFVRKSLARMQRLMSEGTTVVIVSHNLDLLVTQCSRLVWLEQGAVRADGPSAQIAAAYRLSGAAGQTIAGRGD